MPTGSQGSKTARGHQRKDNRHTPGRTWPQVSRASVPGVTSSPFRFLFRSLTGVRSRICGERYHTFPVAAVSYIPATEKQKNFSGHFVQGIRSWQATAPHPPGEKKNFRKQESVECNTVRSAQCARCSLVQTPRRRSRSRRGGAGPPTSTATPPPARKALPFSYLRSRICIDRLHGFAGGTN